MVLVAITALVMLGFAGLALDYAHVRTAGQSLQAAADAASLAGARLVQLDSQASQFASTRQAALGIALANDATGEPVQLDANPQNSPAGDIVVGRWDRETRSFTPDTLNPDAVKVTARRTSSAGGGPVALYFGDLFGAPTSNVARTAVARADRAGSPLVLLLSEGESALSLKGNAVLDALQGNVHVNSEEDCAVSLKGGVLSAQTLAVGGTACISNGSLNALVTEGAGQRPDPFESLPAPAFSGLPLPTIEGSGTYSPGYYDGISMTGGTATLEPGEYVIGDKGVRLRGCSRLVGDGVFLYLPKPARLDLAGSADMRLSGPTGGTYEGVTVFQDRKSLLVNTVTGNSRLELEGTCYLFCGTLDLRGGSGSPKVELGQFVGFGLDLSGASDLTVTGLGLRPPVGASPVLLAQ